MYVVCFLSCRLKSCFAFHVHYSQGHKTVSRGSFSRGREYIRQTRVCLVEICEYANGTRENIYARSWTRVSYVLATEYLHSHFLYSCLDSQCTRTRDNCTRKFWTRTRKKALRFRQSALYLYVRIEMMI